MSIDFIEDRPQPVIVDRSRLERWASCPMQAWHYEHLSTFDFGEPAQVGTECHEINSRTIRQHIESPMRTGEFADCLREAAKATRPDLQPQVVEVFKAGAWLIAEAVTQQDNGEPRHPDEIIRFDGGEDKRSGQIAADYEVDGRTFRLTCEVDLLLATASPVELELIDYKSLFRWWTAEDVKDSFQLGCFYPALIPRNHPTCEAVRVRVLMPSYNAATSTLVIPQKRIHEINMRLDSALRIFAEHYEKPTPDGIPCHPTPNRCQWCACKMQCPLVKRTTTGLAETPAGLLDQLIATQAAADVIAEKLTAHVRLTGQEIESGKVRFGQNKPKAARATPCCLYQIGAK